MSLAGFEIFCLLFDSRKKVNMRFITTKKPALFRENIHVNELQIKNVSLKVPEFL